jgi:hypothetical protein
MWVHQVSQDRRSNSNPCDVSTKQCESAMSVHELKAVGTCQRRPKGQWEDGGDGRDRGQLGRPISIRAAGGWPSVVRSFHGARSVWLPGDEREREMRLRFRGAGACGTGRSRRNKEMNRQAAARRAWCLQHRTGSTEIKQIRQSKGTDFLCAVDLSSMSIIDWRARCKTLLEF